MHGLTISSRTGDAMTGRQKGQAFSTLDADHDILPSVQCAEKYHGGWWYGNCHFANLNGIYREGGNVSYNFEADAITWKPWRGQFYSLKETEMKIRPVN